MYIGMITKPTPISERERRAGAEEPRASSAGYQAERLEGARDAVPQVEADDDHRDDVEGDLERLTEHLDRGR